MYCLYVYPVPVACNLSLAFFKPLIYDKNIKLIFCRLSLNHQIGDRISNHCVCQVPCKCSCQALAQNIYSKLHLYRQAIFCMLKQGRVHTGMEYAKHKYPLSKQDYLSLLRTCPSLQLMHSLVEDNGEGARILPIGVVILVLLENSHFDLVIRFIQDLQNTPTSGEIFLQNCD